MKKSELDINVVSNLYNEYKNLHRVAKELHTSHIRLSNFLRENNYPIQKVGKEKIWSDDEISSMVKDYTEHFKTLEDISNKYGITVKKLRSFFREKNIKISKWNGHIKLEKTPKKEKIIKEYKQCPYCNWKTTDVTGEKHSYSRHLLTKHKIDLEKHIGMFPEDKEIIGKTVEYQKRIICPLCGKKLFVIDDRHLVKIHGITKNEFISKYKEIRLTSPSTKLKLQECMQKMMDNEEWDRKTSNYEKEIQLFLENNGIVFETHNREILSNGKEIDIFIPQYGIGIEFNGNMWHTEWFGKKSKNYHLDKLKECNEKGIKLVQIFEDEYKFNKNIVLTKLKHLLKLNRENVIYARQCSIKEINAEDANVFLSLNHIQGYAKSSVYLGAFFNNELISVMTFVKTQTNEEWELNRFATFIERQVIGIGGKLFSYFVKKYNPNYVKSFADRRWTLDCDNNLYTKLGFKLAKVLNPDYKYFNPKIDKYKRIHKFNFRKQHLHRKYGFPLTMTETEMAKELGYDRIWDCGLFKYVWKKE